MSNLRPRAAAGAPLCVGWILCCVLLITAMETTAQRAPDGDAGPAPPAEDAKSLEAAVDSLLTDPLLSPGERVQGLEALLETHQAPEEAWAYRASDALGRIYLAIERPRVAIPYLEFAVKGMPEDADLLNTLGYLYATEQVELDRSIELVRRALEVAPPETSEQTIGYYRDSLGWAHFQAGDIDSALVHLEAADRMAPGTPEIRGHLVDAYAKSRRVEDATELLIQDLVDSRGFDPSIRSRLRRLHRTTPEGKPIEPELEVERRVRAREAAEIAAIERRGGQVVRLRAGDDTALTATFYPAAGEGQTPAVLLVHMLGDDRSSFASLAERFAAEGVSALALDVRGHGASVSEVLPSAGAFRDDFPSSFRGAVEDVQAALRYLTRLESVDDARIAVIGASMGGLWAAFGSHPAGDVAAFVLLSPGLTDDFEEAIGLDPERPTLLVANADDEASALAAARFIERVDGGRSRYLTISNAGHGTDMLQEVAELEPFLVQWVRDAFPE